MRETKAFLISLIVVLLFAGSLFGQSSDGSSGEWLRIEVRDQGGEPLARACVTIVPREGEIVFRKADGRGTVKVKGLVPGSYRVIVKVEGYEAQKREVVVGHEGQTLAFSLHPHELR